MSSSEIVRWARARSHGRWRYVWGNAVARSLALSALFVLGLTISNMIRSGERQEWRGIIAAWVFGVLLFLVPSAIWLSLKWSRREAAYRLAQEDDRDVGHNEWK